MIAYDRLKFIIPEDQALANKALQVGLQQLAGLTNTSLPLVALTTSQLETTKDLPLISALTQPIPASVANYYSSTLAIGSGSNGDIQVVDILGLVAGWQAKETYEQIVELFSTMDLAYLTLIYQTMINCLDGSYGDTVAGPIVIPVGLPGAGTYVGVDISTPPEPPEYNPTAIQVVMSVLKSAATVEINNLIATYPTQTTQLNQLTAQLCQQVLNERFLQTTINLDYSTLTPNDRSVLYGFIYSLSTYGLETEVGGMSWFLENMADLTTLGGEAIVACLREGRNELSLAQSGVTASNKIPSEPIPPPPSAPLIPSTYTEAEAKNLIIK
jgi:hypothetical protein